MTRNLSTLQLRKGMAATGPGNRVLVILSVATRAGSQICDIEAWDPKANCRVKTVSVAGTRWLAHTAR